MSRLATKMLKSAGRLAQAEAGFEDIGRWQSSVDRRVGLAGKDDVGVGGDRDTFDRVDGRGYDECRI